MRSLARVWAAWTGAHLRRLAREGVVLRALCGPALLLTVTLVATGAMASIAQDVYPVAVADGRQASALREAGVEAAVVADPLDALERGDTDRVVVTSAAGVVFHARPSGWARWSGRRAREELLIEAVLRDELGAAWRLDVEPLADLTPELPGQVSTLARILGVLYTLYAVVLATASMVRDREQGVLEADGALPLPGWSSPAARASAVWLAVGGTLVGTQVLVGALLGLATMGAVILGGLTAVTTGVALGIAAPAGRGLRPVGPFQVAPGGLSAPLSQALVATMALGGTGWAMPAHGRFLPVGGLSAGADAPLALGVSALLAAGLMAWSVRRAGAAGW